MRQTIVKVNRDRATSGADPICPPPSKVLNPMIPWERKERQGVMVRREARRKDQIIREGGEGVTVGVRLQMQLTGGGGEKKKRRTELLFTLSCKHLIFLLIMKHLF